MLKIRLRQQGSRNRKTYRLVATDSRSKRDGKYVENLGYYVPQSPDEKNAELNEGRLCYWIGQGAAVSERAASLIKRYAPGAYKLLHEKAAK